MFLGELWRRILMLLRSRQFHREMDEELKSHLAMKESDLRVAGLPGDEARYTARRRLGNLTLLHETSRRMWGWTALEALSQDLRYAARILRKSPGFAAAATLTLALGIGANTAIFSLIDAVMLRAMPVHDPARLVQFCKFWGGQRGSISYPLFEFFRDNSRSFGGVLAQSSPNKQEIAFRGVPETVETQMVSGSYYAVLGVEPVVGRALAAGASSDAVIGYQYWKRRFGLDPAAIGKTFTLHKTVFTIVGVTPPEFFGAFPGHAPDVTFPVSMDAQVRGERSWLADPDVNWLLVMGRLKPGVSVERARAEARVLFRNRIRAEASRETDPRDKQATLDQKLLLDPAGSGFDSLRAKFSEPLLLLMSIVALVLMLACANLSSLLLARAAARQREISVRLAIGASRSRLLRQFLAESLLLALAGGAAGAALAQLFCRGLVAIMSNGESLFLPIQPDLRVLAFTAAVSLATCVVVGLAPALHAMRLNASPGLKQIRSGGRRRLGRMLVIAQIAISLVLLIGASLFLRTLNNLHALDAGFRRDGVLVFGIDSDRAGYKDQRLRDLQARVVERLNALPGVSSASLSLVLVISGGGWTGSVDVEGYTHRPDENNQADLNRVGPKFFQTMGTPVLLGREFDARDSPASLKVAIVNQSFARHYFGNRSPLGKHVNKAQIVGVVKDVKYLDLREAFPRTVYFAAAQDSSPQSWSSYLVRVASGDPLRLSRDVEETVRQIDPALRVREPGTLAEYVDRSILNERIMAMLGGFFGLLALALACIGIFGVMAFHVARRTNEFGIRIALGARRGDVIWNVLSEVTTMLAAGTVLGLVAATSVSGFARSLLFELKPTDPAAFALAVAALAAAALVAGYIPARRAANVDPMDALRSE